jgi:hypothetical protein
MAGFRKAKAEQAALKMGIYGPPGSGKTFTSLLMAEGLAKATGKRIAVVDTEHGTDFYCQAVKTRQTHPEAFDFDSIYTRSLTEVNTACKSLDPAEYGVVVIDSITHLWQAAIQAYGGKQTSIGTIPMHAWGKIKKPYKELTDWFMGTLMHVIICGRQGTEYATDEETEELKAIGLKMKAEGETPYEPHILIRMESIKPRKTNEVASIVAYIEKDRTGVLAGRSFINPNFETLCAPLLPLLGSTQAQMLTGDAAAAQDAEAIAQANVERERFSASTLKEMGARIELAKDEKELKKVGAEITPSLKAKMLTEDVASLREKYLARLGELTLPADKEAA